MRFKKTILACGITLLALLSARPARADTSAVAVLSSDKRTLTFVNPKDKTGAYAVSQDGTKYSGTVLSASGAAKDDYMAGDDNRGFKEAKSTVTKIVIKDALAPDDASYYFADFKKLESVEGLDKLTLPEKAAGLFYNDTALSTVDMSKTDASKTTDISYMFSRNSIGDDAETLKLPDSDSLTTVKLPSFKSVTNAKYAFWSAKSIKSLDVSGLNPDATSLTHAFGQMSDVTYITLPDKFANKADDLSYLFYEDGSLSTLDGDKFDLSNATSARYMIAGAGLITLNMAKWHMSNMTNLEGFARGSKLTAVDLSNAEIASVNLSSAFASMDNLASLNLAGIKKATNVESLAANDTKLTSVNVPFDTSSATDFSYAFQNVGLEELDLSSWNTTNAKSMKMMFTSSSDLSKVTFGSKFKFNNATLPNAKTGDGFTGKWTKETDYSKQTSSNCYSADDLAKLSDVSGTWVWSGKDTRTEFFVVVSGSAANLIKVYRSKSYKNGSGDFEDVDGNKYSGTGYKAVLDGTAPGWTNNSNIKTFNIKYKFKPAGHFDYMFYKMSNLTTINGMEKLDFTNTTTASHMFDGSGMKSLDLTVFDDTNTPMRDLKDVSYFLANMPNLTSVTFAKGDDNPRQEFYTRNATNFSHLFENDTAITSLGFGYWNKEDLGLYTNNATDTSYMFAGMTNLRSISGFQLSAGYFGNVRNAESMFDGTVNLTDLGSYGYGTDRPEASFAFYHLQNARHMFRNTGLTQLKMQFFHFKNTLTDATGMFDGSKITQMIIGSNNAFNGYGSFQDMSKVDDAYTNRWVRNGKAYTVDEISKLGDLSGTWTPEADSGSESDKTDTSGNQYAVKVGSKVYFIRSTEGEKNGTIKDIEGNTYTGDIYSDFSKKQWKSNDVSSVIFKQKIVAPSDISYWFSDMSNLKVIKNTNLLDTSNTANMYHMFQGDSNLASVNIGSWNMSKVTTINSMFDGDKSLNSVGDLSKWDVSGIADMWCVFRDCNSLTSVGDLSNWNTGKVQNFAGLFQNCFSLLSVGDLSNWNTSSSNWMNCMFQNCYKLTTLGDLSNWDVSRVTDMGSMFYNCGHLATIGSLANWNTSSVTSTREMFRSDSSLTSLDLSGWDMSHNGNMYCMFDRCANLITLGNLSHWNVSSTGSTAWMFSNCQKLTGIKASSWNLSNVGYVDGMFYNCRAMTSSDVSGITIGSKNQTLQQTFAKMVNVDTLDVSKIDTTNVTSLNATFYVDLGDNPKLTKIIGMSKWNTSNVTNMTQMFYYQRHLTAANLSSFDTRKVTDFSCMFEGSGFEKLNLSNFKGPEVTSTAYMFKGMPNIKSVDLSNFDTPKLTNATEMFAAYEVNNTVHDTLETVIIPKLNVKNADVRNFFKSHTKISTITLGSDWVFKKDGSSWTNKLNDVPTSGNYDGTWNDKYTSSELAENWTSSMADTYTWTDFSGNNSHVYAVIDKDGTTMSFIRSNDTVKLGQAGTKLTATNGLDYTGWVYDANGGWVNRLPSEAYDKIKTVKFLTKVKPTSTAYWFNGGRGFNGLVRVTGAQRLDMSEVTDMQQMFRYDRNLVSLDASSWKMPKATNASYMFYGDDSLTSVGDLSGWQTGNIQDTSFMFAWANKLTSLGDLGSWDMSNNTDMNCMFGNMHNLVTLGDLSKWQTGKVRDTSWMFADDYKLTTVGDLSKWNVGNVTNMAEMFRLCNDLTNVGNLDNWNVSNVTDMGFMFVGCYELTNVGDLSKWQTGKVKDTSCMFSSDHKLTKVGDLSKWDMSSNTNMADMFDWCLKLTSVGNLDNWNVSNVTDMGSMFSNCRELTNVGDLSKWQTGKVKNTGWMFASDKKLTKIGNLDNWDMSSNTNMASMFNWCDNLITIGDLSKWNVGNVTDMAGMFNNCNMLTNVGNLKNWDVRKVTDMSNTFSNMTLLKSLDMSNWSTDSLIRDSYMLYGMYRLESISFGPKTRIDTDVHLNDPTAYGNATWGKWVRTSDNKALSGYDLSAMGATSRPTTWVAKRMSLTVKMRAEDKGTNNYDETLESFDINSSGDSGVVDKTHLTNRINFFTKHAYDMTENNVPDNFDYDAESWHMTYTVDFDRVKSQISMALNNMPGVTPSYVTNFLNGSTDSYNNRSIRAAYGKNSFELNILYKVGSDNLFDNFKYDSSTGTFALNRYGNGTTSYNPLVKSAFIFDKIPYAFKITKMSVQDKLSPSATITGGRYSYSNMSHYAGIAVDNINPGDNVVITIDFETSLSDIINYSKTNNNMITPYFGPSEKDAAGERVIDMHVEGSWGERYDDLQIKNPDVYMLTPVAVLVDSDRNETMYYKTKSIFNTWGDKPKDATVNIPNYHWDSTVNGYDNMADGVTSLDWNGSNGMHASRIEYDNGLNWGLLNKKDSHYDSAYENVALQSLQTNNDFNSAYTFINMDHNNYEHLQSLNGNIGKLLDNKQNTSISYEIQAPKTVADQANTVSQTNKFVSIPYATLNVFAQSLDFYHEPIYSYKDWINIALDNPLNQSFKGQVYSIDSDENLSEYNNPSAYATKIPNQQESHTSNGGTNWQMDGYRGSVDAINVDRYYGLLSNMDASSGKYVLSAKAGYGISYPFQYTILDYMSHVMTTTKAPKLQAQTSNLFDDLYIKDANNEELTTNYKSTIPAISSKISTGLLSPSLTAMVNKIKAVDKTVTHYGYGDTNADYQALDKSEQNDVDYLIGYMSTLSGINSMYPAWAQASFEPQAKVFKNGHQVYADEVSGTNGFNRSYIKSDLPQGIYPIRFYGNYGDVKIDVNDWEVKLIGKRLLTKGGDNKNDEISVEGALSGDSTDDVSRLKSRYHLTQDQAEKLHDFLMNNDK